MSEAKKALMKKGKKMEYTSDVADGPIMTKGYWNKIKEAKKKGKK